MKCLAVVLIVSWVGAQDYNYEDLRHPKYVVHFKQIPKRFEVKGGRDSNKDFTRYFEEIEDLAKHENISVLYKIKLEVVKPTLKFVGRKSVAKRTKTKKYNIPLKKNSMKLSNFEVMLRKMAEQTGHGKSPKVESANYAVTTESDRKIFSTKQIQLKFKPIISRVKTNYTKIIKPVRNNIITLTV